MKQRRRRRGSSLPENQLLGSRRVIPACACWDVWGAQPCHALRAQQQTEPSLAELSFSPQELLLLTEMLWQVGDAGGTMGVAEWGKGHRKQSTSHFTSPISIIIPFEPPGIFLLKCYSGWRHSKQPKMFSLCQVEPLLNFHQLITNVYRANVIKSLSCKLDFLIRSVRLTL